VPPAQRELQQRDQCLAAGRQRRRLEKRLLFLGSKGHSIDSELISKLVIRLLQAVPVGRQRQRLEIPAQKVEKRLAVEALVMLGPREIRVEPLPADVAAAIGGEPVISCCTRNREMP
jgi:hypothetical protein